MHPLDYPQTLQEALERIKDLESDIESLSAELAEKEDEIDDHTAEAHCTSELIDALGDRDWTPQEEDAIRALLDDDPPLDQLDALPPAKLAQIIEALLTEPRFDMARRIMERNGRLSA